MELLEAQGSLSRLNLRVLTWLDFENLYISSQLKNLSSSISFLNLQIQGNEMYGTVPRILLKRLRSLKNLIQVKISFISFDFQDSKTFKRLFKSLLCLKKLKSLSIHFIIGGHSKGNQVDMITKYLRRFTQLQALQLNFDRCMNPSERDHYFQRKDILDHLPSVFSKLTHLTKVHLSFVGRRSIQARALTELFKSFQSLKNLSDFTLNTLDLTLAPIANEASSETLSESLVYLNASTLRRLSLHIYSFTDFASLCKISRALERFTALELLHINLFGCGATSSKNLAQLSSSLTSFTSLASLNLTFPYSLQMKFVIGNVASALNSLQQLVNLRLDFPNFRETELEQLQQLATSIGNLTYLQYLDLCFSSKRSMSDAAVISLSENLQKLVLLKNLSLAFEGCIAITNTGIFAIVNAMTNLDLLSSLHLDFTNNPHIDEKVINKIGLLLQSRTSLYSFSLSMLSCVKLRENEDSFLGLFRSLKEARHIQEVFLNIPETVVSKKEMERLKQRKIISFEIPESYNASTYEKMSLCLQ